MRAYTINEVNKFRDIFIKRKYREHDITLGGKEFSFFDVPQDCNPALECFALVLAGKKDNGYLIGVSNHVEATFRPLWAFHEYVEVAEPGADRKLRCIAALKQELDVARIVLETERDLPRYLAARKRFFGQLVNYALERLGEYGKETVREFNESLEHLISLG